MANPSEPKTKTVDIDLGTPVWESIFTVSPLTVIGTREESGSYDLAPKHMVVQLGWGNHFGFVCTPRHATYRNIRRGRFFTVSFPRPSQVVLASLAAEKRDESCVKPSLAALPTRPAKTFDGVFLDDSFLYLECELERFVDGFGENSLIAGKIVTASAREDALRSSDRDDADLIYSSPLLAYLYPGRFARIDRTFSFPFPKHFER